MTFYGSQKMFGLFGGSGYSATIEGFTKMGIPPAFAHLAIAGEFFGGLGVLVGCLTPIAAFGVVSVMAVATFKGATSPGALYALTTSGNPADASKIFYPLMLGMAALAIVVMGAGSYSLDAKIFRRGKK